MIITAPPLTGQAVDHRRLLLFLFFVWRCAVFSVHLTDRGGAFSLDLGVKFLVKENLVDQVWLDGAGLCRGLGGPIVISWMMRYKSPSEYILRNGKRLGLTPQMANRQDLVFKSAALPADR